MEGMGEWDSKALQNLFRDELAGGWKALYLVESLFDS